MKIILSMAFAACLLPLTACQSNDPNTSQQVEELNKELNFREIRWKTNKVPQGNLLFTAMDLRQDNGKIVHLLNLKQQGDYVGKKAPLARQNDLLVSIVEDVAKKEICRRGLLKSVPTEPKSATFKLKRPYTTTVLVHCR